MNIWYEKRFERQFKKMPEDIKDIAEEKVKIFRDNPFDLRLKTHKLKGRLSDCWAFSVNHSYRIIFDFNEENDKKVARFYSIGTHQLYD